jgi:outer membrane protein TolC
MRSLAAAGLVVLGTTGTVFAAEVMSVRDAILQAVQSNPGVGEAAANRRATETELRQVQSTLLPQVRLEAARKVQRPGSDCATARQQHLAEWSQRVGRSPAATLGRLHFT